MARMQRALPVLLVALTVAGCGSRLPMPRTGKHGEDEVAAVVAYPPPPGKVEIIQPPPPGMKHPVWVDGEQEWKGSRWVWKEGGWHDEAPDEVYAPPITERQPDGRLVHLGGKWRKAPGPPP
jgi:hypothetical protein